MTAADVAAGTQVAVLHEDLHSLTWFCRVQPVGVKYWPRMGATFLRALTQSASCWGRCVPLQQPCPACMHASASSCQLVTRCCAWLQCGGYETKQVHRQVYQHHTKLCEAVLMCRSRHWHWHRGPCSMRKPCCLLMHPVPAQTLALSATHSAALPSPVQGQLDLMQMWLVASSSLARCG